MSRYLLKSIRIRTPFFIICAVFALVSTQAFAQSTDATTEAGAEQSQSSQQPSNSTKDGEQDGWMKHHGYDGPPHAGGKYARLGFGVGFASHALWGDKIFTDEKGMIGQYTGFTMAWELAFGGFVGKNIALHATAFGNTMLKPVARTSDNKNYGLGDLERMGLIAIGPGITTYFGSSGLLFSVSPAVARLRAKVDTGNGFAVLADTDWGFAFDSLLGYEWRVSESMSVGMGVSGGMYIIPDADIDPSRRGYNVGGRFFVAWD